MMRLANRSMLTVVPLEPFGEWLEAIDPEADAVPLEMLQADPSVYLIEEVEDEDQFEEVLGRVWETIFDAELAAWTTDPASWPPERSLEMFAEWFALGHSSMVFDLGEEELELEELESF